MPSATVEQDASQRSTARPSYPAVLVGALAGFVAGWVWYGPFLFGAEVTRLRGLGPAAAAAAAVPAAKMLVELARCLVLAYVIARLVGRLGIAGGRRAASLGLWLWIGFPVTLLAGSVLWEDVPWKLATLHAGDWLLKVLLMATIAGVWRRPASLTEREPADQLARASPTRGSSHG
jgi:hypothetical protein